MLTALVSCVGIAVPNPLTSRSSQHKSCDSSSYSHGHGHGHAHAGHVHSDSCGHSHGSSSGGGHGSCGSGSSNSNNEEDRYYYQPLPDIDVTTLGSANPLCSRAMALFSQLYGMIQGLVVVPPRGPGETRGHDVDSELLACNRVTALECGNILGVCEVLLSMKSLLVRLVAIVAINQSMFEMFIRD